MRRHRAEALASRDVPDLDLLVEGAAHLSRSVTLQRGDRQVQRLRIRIRIEYSATFIKGRYNTTPLHARFDLFVLHSEKTENNGMECATWKYFIRALRDVHGSICDTYDTKYPKPFVLVNRCMRHTPPLVLLQPYRTCERAKIR